MPIFIYHGTGLVAISSQISHLKQSFDSMSITELNGKEVPFDQALVNIGNSGLFSESRLIILDNYPEKTDIGPLIQDPVTTIVFRFSKTLPATAVILQTAKKANATIQNFTEADEVSVFPFLDSLGEKINVRLLSLKLYILSMGDSIYLPCCIIFIAG